MKAKTKYRLKIAAIVILWVIICLAVSDIAYSHENEKYKHQPTGMRYGGGYIWGGIYRTFVNAENTQCRDLIFTHNKLHVTDPFSCETVDGGIKDKSHGRD